MSIAQKLDEILGTTGGGYLRDEQVTVINDAVMELIRLQRIVDGVTSKTALDIVVEKMKAEDALEQLVKVIAQCRESAGLQASPDGPSGDVRNLMFRGSVARKVAGMDDHE
jgi:hypothetical protein